MLGSLLDYDVNIKKESELVNKCEVSGNEIQKRKTVCTREIILGIAVVLVAIFNE